MRTDTPSTGLPASGVLDVAVAAPKGRWGRLLARAAARVVGGGAVSVAGLAAGAAVSALTEGWLPGDTHLGLGFGVAAAIWFTAGMGWLRPRRWPRLLVVFGLTLGAGVLLMIVVLRYLHALGISI